MEIQLIRNATLVVRMAGQTILIDPMFSAAEAMDTVPNAPNTRRNPLVGLPFDDAALAGLIAGLNLVIVTHTHPDHWDEPAVQMLPKDLPLLCQPADSARLAQEGFAAVQPVDEVLEWQGLRLVRRGGQHGTGEIGQLMAPVSGFVIEAPGEPLLYLAGDTIWCAEVAETLAQFQPAVTVVNAGAAQFVQGGPITMTAEDVVSVCQALPTTQVVAVHMEAINHCLLERAALQRHAEAAGVASRVRVPQDGETFAFGV